MATFMLDIYEGWTRDQIKDRCLELCRSVDELQLIIAMLVEYGPEAVEKLPVEFRERAKRLNYRDESDGAD